jgi:hypothetical protein
MKPPTGPGTTVIIFSMIGLISINYLTGLLLIPTNEYGKIGSSRGGGINWNVYKKSSFVRLSNISLAYTIPTALTQKWKIGALKFYINAVNAAVFSKWITFDPDIMEQMA